MTVQKKKHTNQHQSKEVNVGGSIFTLISTTMHLLDDFTGRKFRDEFRRPFLDFDPGYFKMILKWEVSKVIPHRAIDLQNLAILAPMFGLNELTNVCYRRYAHFIRPFLNTFK